MIFINIGPECPLRREKRAKMLKHVSEDAPPGKEGLSRGMHRATASPREAIKRTSPERYWLDVMAITDCRPTKCPLSGDNPYQMKRSGGGGS